MRPSAPCPACGPCVCSQVRGGVTLLNLASVAAKPLPSILEAATGPWVPCDVGLPTGGRAVDTAVRVGERCPAVPWVTRPPLVGALKEVFRHAGMPPDFQPRFKDFELLRCASQGGGTQWSLSPLQAFGRAEEDHSLFVCTQRSSCAVVFVAAPAGAAAWRLLERGGWGIC